MHMYIHTYVYAHIIQLNAEEHHIVLLIILKEVIKSTSAGRLW